MTQFFLSGRADMRPFFTFIPFILCVFIPAITMRLWAEERKGNTLEMLLTFPVPVRILVLGKFLAGLFFYAAALLSTFVIPLMLFVLGRPDMGMIAGGYLGSLILGAFFLAVGIFISGLCADQIVAFIVAMMVSFSLYLAGTDFVAMSIDGWLPGFGSLLKTYFGTANHFDAFVRGVVDSRDVIYFILGSTLFLILNGFWLEGRMRSKARQVFVAAVLICAGIFFTGNWFCAGFSLGRFDLTEGRIYTVSQAAREIFEDLKSPVTVKFYASPKEKMPAGMKTLEEDVIGKLEEFRVASKGKFQYKLFHMDAAETSAAQNGEETMQSQLARKGIEPFQIQSIDADEVGVKLIYSSLSISYKEKPEEIIAQVIPDSLQELEYLLMSKIYRMTLNKMPHVALVAPYEDRQVDPQMQMLLAQLGASAPDSYREDNYEYLPLLLRQEGYEVSRIRLQKNETIAPDTDTLVIVEPELLSDRQRYEIARFLSGGGSVMFAVQNYEYQYQPQAAALSVMVHDKKPSVNELLENWGLSVNSKILLDEQHEVINISGGRVGPFSMPVPVKLPVQIYLTPQEMNENVSITSHLSSLFYLWGSALDIDPVKMADQKLKLTTLLSSTTHSWLVDFMPEFDGSYLLGAESLKRGPFPLAVLVEGIFKNPYQGQAVPAWGEGQEESSEPAVESEPRIESKPAKLLVVGAATMFQKQLAQSGGHLNFFINAVDALTLGDRLVNIRSKRPIDRSIGRISTPAKLFWRLSATLLVPVLIALLGTFRVMLRRKVKHDYLKSLSHNA